MALLIGADPELFVKNGEDFISAYGMIPGTKQNPFPVENGAVQVDGMALEFNVTPSSSYAQFNKSVNQVLKVLREMVPSNFDLVISPTAHFPKDYMEKLPDEAKELGCDPDYNAYTGEENPPPKDPGNMRTAAGHIHIGWTEGVDPYSEQHFNMCKFLVKELDWTLGVPSIYYDKSEGSSKRRLLYGKAGAFRPKSYGLEYRVLSNYWLNSSSHMKMVFDTARRTYHNAIKEKITHEALPQNLFNRFEGQFPLEDLQAENIINSNNKKIVQYVMDYIKYYR